MSRLKLAVIGAGVLASCLLFAGLGTLVYQATAVAEGRAPAVNPDDPATVAAPAPAKATFRSIWHGKPPRRGFVVTLVLENTQDHPVWFITRHSGEKPLAGTGIFAAGTAFTKPAAGTAFTNPFVGQGFNGAKYGGKGRLVLIKFFGDKGFVALRLPAHGKVRLDEYSIEAWADISAMEIWAADSLKVNNETPLERWLPFPTLSDADVAIPARTVWDYLNLDRETDFPTEAVKAVHAAGVRKWVVPITGLKKVDPQR